MKGIAMGPTDEDNDALNASLEELLAGEPSFKNIEYEPDFDNPDFARWYALDDRADSDLELD